MEPCGECDLSLLQFHYKYFGKSWDLFDLCVSHKLILDKKDYEQCDQPASLDFARKLWRCQKWVAKQKKKRAKCNWLQCVYKCTFFEKAHLDLETVLFFVNIYLSYNSVTLQLLTGPVSAMKCLLSGVWNKRGRLVAITKSVRKG